jgi:hypothetical protein
MSGARGSEEVQCPSRHTSVIHTSQPEPRVSSGISDTNGKLASTSLRGTDFGHPTHTDLLDL